MVTMDVISRSAGDAEIHRQIAQQLAETNRQSLRRLAVKVQNGHVTLRGLVQSFYEKQLAIHSCHAVTGAGCLRDEIAVA